MKLPSLTIWQKLLLVIMLMALPVTPLIYFFFESRNEQIAVAEAETLGIEYLADARQLLDLLANHRDASQALLAGDSAFRSSIGDSRLRISTAMQLIDKIDGTVSARWDTTPRWTAIKAGWTSLSGQNLSREESFQRHKELLSAVLQLMRAVSDQSSLTTDPKLDTIYLLNTMINDVLPTMESLSQVRALGAAALARGSATPDEVAQLQFLARQIAEKSNAIEQAIVSIEWYNPEAAKKLSQIWRPALQLSNEVGEKIHRDLIRPTQSLAGARSFYEQTTRALREYSAFYDEGSTTVSSILSTRISTLNRQRTIQIAIVVVVLSLAAFVVFSISRGIAIQTAAISSLFAEISTGNLNARAAVLSNDELGEIATELNLMLDDILQLVDSREEKESIHRNIKKLLNEVSGVASGDLTRDAEVTSDVTGAIADSFNYMLAELRQIIASVQSTTAAVTGSAKDVQQTASELSYGSQAQSNAIGHASAAIADMARSIQKVSQSATLAANIARRAVSDAKGGAATVGKTIDGMNAIRGRVQETSKRIKRLGESSQEIGEIVRLIGDIADRTSILALNASIQASTAGEAGKGFAVVAEEVERLAVRAAESTRKISALIKSVQGDTTEAVRAMEETTKEVVGGSQHANEAGQRLRDIEQISQEMASLIAQISDASRQQAAGSEEVAKNVAGISQFTQQTASGAQLTEASTRHLAELALELNASISRFKLPEGV